MKRLVPLGAVAAALAFAPGASAAVDLDGRAATLTLSKRAATTLASAGVRVARLGSARIEGRRVTFSITDGDIDPRTAVGAIDLGGGLRLSGGGRSIALRDLVVHMRRSVRLSAEVRGERIMFFDLTGRRRVSRPGFSTEVRGLTARLTRTAAQMLNRRFRVQAFTRGLPLGGVRISAVPGEAELLGTGATSVALDVGMLQALASLGVTPGIIGPGTLDGTTAAFPITGGTVNVDLSGGQIDHAGGISLTAGAIAVRLESFEIRLGPTPQLFAAINGSPKVAIFDLGLSAPAIDVSGLTITVGNVPLALTQAAADALNATFGIPAFTAGMVFGVAGTQATAR